MDIFDDIYSLRHTADLAIHDGSPAALAAAADMDAEANRLTHVARIDAWLDMPFPGPLSMNGPYR
jgi:hypothetical protein